ncbi:MAG: hypothetical protein CVU89_08155 [Firmicutes bacterium HGW-Firmicutes-14]|nr:MAG: hypothetical protein CVU89_08155 [Firmicutes bacterium HGW-Firmicutes-14]
MNAITETILTAVNLSVKKGKNEILRVPRIDFIKGGFTAVTGPNGAGKSTLLKALGFLEKISYGEIFFKGQPVKGRKDKLAVRRCMATVFQDPLLLRGTVLENVAIGLRLRGMPRRDRNEKAIYWLDKLRVSHLACRDAGTLSGGEAQRVSLARAMAMEPEVLFLDEPFTYLDMPTRAALVSELKEILTEAGTTALMVAHDLNEIPFLADRMIVLLDGQVRQSGPVGQVLSCPESRDVAEFLGVDNIWPGRLETGVSDRRLFRVDGSGVSLIVNGSSGHEHTGQDSDAWHFGDTGLAACIRPEHVMAGSGVFPESAFRDEKSNLFEGRIESVYPYGHFYRIKARAGSGAGDMDITALAAVAGFPEPPRKGDRIWVMIPPEKVSLMKL